jgi:hypothetical protein
MTEAKIQHDIIKWFTNTYCLKFHKDRSLIFAVPNGGHRQALEAVLLKATGVLSGVSDLIVIHKMVLLFIEVKSLNGGQSVHQREFQQRVEEQGFRYELVRSLDEFKELIFSL